MVFSFPQLVFLFLIYAFIGWLWETIYCSILDKKFAYRGFLVGPYCPVYGFAVTTVLVLTEPFQANIFWLFISGIVIATLFEYIAGWFLETFFHMKLWDYSKEWANLKGRVAPRISLFWGFGIVILVKFIQPLVMDLVRQLPSSWALGVVAIMSADLIWTVTDTAKFHSAAISLENRFRVEQDRILANVRQEVGDLAEQAELFSRRLEQLRAHLTDFMQEQKVKPFRFNQRRMLKNYSNLSMEDAPLLTDLRKQLANFKNKHSK